MTAASRALDQLTALDDLARRNTFLANVDSRAKLIVVLALLFTVASFDPHDITRPIPLVLFFTIALSLGQIPWTVVLTRLIVASPFAVLIAIWNPLFDTTPVAIGGGLELSAGWFSFLSVLMRFAFALGGVLVLIATTGFNEICRAARSLGMPVVLVSQLLLLYRYFFVIADEVSRMLRSHSLRANGTHRPALRVARSMLGELLLRSLARAERVHAAMLCRGFTGTMPVRRRTKLGFGDILFAGLWLCYFAIVRTYDLTELVGQALLRYR